MVVLDLPPPPPVLLLERQHRLALPPHSFRLHLQEPVLAPPLPYLKPVLLLPVAVLQ
jgi:hypothetical protein